MLVTRLATPDDMPFVLDSFVEEFKGSVYADGLVRSGVRALFLRLVSAGWLTSVLCEDETPDEIIAWCTWFTPLEVAWVHTKGIYRRHGMAKLLLERIGVSKGRVKTPFIPSPAFARTARSHGWDLLHRPWMGQA